MSDVSGIPYMGPMGVGNLFAPQFAYNPQMNAAQASAAYAPQGAYAQNVTNNLYSNQGGFGNLTNYYSQQVANSYGNIGRMAPVGFYSGGNEEGIHPYRGPPVTGVGVGSGSIFDQGAANNFTLSGGGYSFPSIPNMSTSHTGGLGGGPSVDWTTLFRSPSTDYGTFQGGGSRAADPYSGMGMPGGLGSPLSAPSGASPLNWSGLLGGEGGAKSAPSLGGTSPSYGQLGGDRPYEPPAPTMPSSKALLGYEPDLFPTKTSKSQDQPAFDFSGGNAGWGNAPAATTPSSKALLGYEPSSQNQAVDWGNFQSPAADYGTFQGGWGNVSGDKPQGPEASGALAPGGGLTASDLSARARDRLAEIMKPAQIPEPPGVPATPNAPFDQPSLEEFQRNAPFDRPSLEDFQRDMPRPPGDIPNAGQPFPARPEGPARPEPNPPRPSQGVPFTVEKGKEAGVRAVQPRLVTAVQGGAQIALPPGYSVEVFSGLRTSGSQGYHRSGNAMDVRIIGPDGPIPDRGPDTTGMYTLLARGVKTWAAQNDPSLLQTGRGGLGWGGAFETSAGSGVGDQMHFDLGGSRGNLNPQSRFGTLQPLSEAERNAMPAYIPLLGENQVPLDAAAPRGTGSAYKAYPTQFGGFPEDTSPADTESWRGGAFHELPAKGTPEYNAEVYEPMGRKDLLMPRPENQAIGGASQYADFTRSGNVEDRRNEALTRDQLAALKARGASYVPEAEPAGAASNPLSAALGFGNLPEPRGSPPAGMVRPGGIAGDAGDNIFDERFRGDASSAFDPATFQSPANDYSTFQQQPFLPPWQAAIPAEPVYRPGQQEPVAGTVGRNRPEVVDAVKAMSARLGIEPAEVAAMIQQETHDNPSALWNPQIPPNRYGYRGMTQMGPGTFADAARMGTTIGNFPTIEDYQRGTAEQQIDAYGDWLDLYTRQQPQGAAALVNSGALAGLPPGEAAAIMQGAQFGPNATRWVRALEGGDVNMPTTGTEQAPELRPYTVSRMADVAREHMAAWPQQQLYSNYYSRYGR